MQKSSLFSTLYVTLLGWREALRNTWQFDRKVYVLSDRRQALLKILIEEYITHALPVGSRTLVERYNLGFSPATVRSELSHLEEAGYLTHPHTSAGRVPTDFGYRAFVDDLLRHQDFSDQDDLAQSLRESARELDDLLEKTSQALIRLTDCMTLLVPPRSVQIAIRVINLISLSDDRTLMVIVSRDGQVFNTAVELPRAISEDERIRIEADLNTLFAGKQVATTQDSCELPRDTCCTEELKLFIDEFYLCLKEQSKSKPQPGGMTNLLGQPEFKRSEAILPVLEKLEDDTMLLHLFHDALNSDTPYIRIGHENNSEALAGMSLVATQFGEGSERGMIAIIGPTRMNYSQVLRAISAAKSVLNTR